MLGAVDGSVLCSDISLALSKILAVLLASPSDGVSAVASVVPDPSASKLCSSKMFAWGYTKVS